MAKLSLKDKYTIQGMLHSKKDASEIAEVIGKSEKSIQTYIDEELGKIQKTVAKIQSEKKIVSVEVTDEIYEKTLHLLGKRSGVDSNDGRKILNKIIPLLEKSPKNAEELFAVAVRNLKTGPLFIKRTQGGNKGISIMTQAASEKSDSAVKKNSKSRHMKGNIYRPEEKEID